jgi:NADH-quinone oxidoreductase subunit C
MKEEKLAKEIKKKLGACFVGYELKPHARGKKRVFVRVNKDDIKEAADVLFNGFHARLSTVSAVEHASVFELVYHFSFDHEGVIVSLRAEVPKANPAIDSISGITLGANFIEREIHDFFGITFRGHPGLKKLVLPDNWPKGKYPLRKGG